MSEQWKPIPEWESRYEISDSGKVRSWYYGRKHLDTPRILRTKIDRYGYEIVSLHQGDRKKSYAVHRLVATMFLPNPEKLPQINHKDGIKTNNRVANLEWCTASHNIRHAFQHSLIKRESCSKGQQKRYASEEQREISKLRAMQMWKDEEMVERMLSSHRTEECRQKMSKKRKLQPPPTAGRKRINNGTIEKAVPMEELSAYLEKGWKIGRLAIKRKRS